MYSDKIIEFIHYCLGLDPRRLIYHRYLF